MSAVVQAAYTCVHKMLPGSRIPHKNLVFLRHLYVTSCLLSTGPILALTVASHRQDLAVPQSSNARRGALSTLLDNSSAISDPSVLAFLAAHEIGGGGGGMDDPLVVEVLV